MESNKTRIDRNLNEKKKIDMDRTYIKKTQQQYHKKSPPMQPTSIKEKRQVQEHMEKRSGAGDEGGTSHMGHSGDNSLRPCTMEATRSISRWSPMLHYRSNNGISQVSK